MLAVFEDSTEDLVHIVMIEAKGVGVWNQKQLKGKIERFKNIFADEKLLFDGKPFALVHYVLISPREPNRKYDQEVVEFLDNAVYMPLTYPEKVFYKVTRCNRIGKPMKRGEHWKIVSEKIKNSPRHHSQPGFKSPLQMSDPIDFPSSPKNLMGARGTAETAKSVVVSLATHPSFVELWVARERYGELAHPPPLTQSGTDTGIPLR